MNYVVCRSVICRCRFMISWGCLHTICTFRMVCENCITLVITSCVCLNASCCSSNRTMSLCRSRSAMMVPGSTGDTSATCSSMDLDIAADQAHQPVTIVSVDFGWSWRRRYYNNRRNRKRYSWYCCCCFVSSC